MNSFERKQKKRARRKAFFVFLYSLFARMNFAGELKFMNHGYAELNGKPDFLELAPENEKFRYSLQLYHFLASQVNWESKHSAEISSGNGGGTEYIYKTFKPQNLVGIDLAPACVKSSNENYAQNGLSFMVGNAQDLPLDNESIDILINVESSLNYPNPDAFIKEVHRVLKPGGHFIFADYFRPARLKRVEKSLKDQEFLIEKRLNLSKNIILSLVLSEPRKQDLLKKRIPFFCRRLFSQFIFSGKYYEEEKERFEKGEKTYLSFVLQKKECEKQT